jgi:hypothetical protein
MLFASLALVVLASYRTADVDRRVAGQGLLPTPALEWDLPFRANGLGQIFAVPAVIVIATPLSVLTGASPRLP